ncbi:MAG: SDR family NAD(P)-dependent oxidoreductase [Pseudomonadales bacterium]
MPIEVIADCKTSGVDAIAVGADVAKDADCRRLTKAAVDAWGRVDILVNSRYHQGLCTRRSRIGKGKNVRLTKPGK